MEYRDVIELPFSCRQLFDLVADIERYPEFLPHWDTARVLRTEGNRLYVQQQLRAGPLQIQLRSVARLECDRAICITAEGGPLRQLDISWCFAPQLNNSCRVELNMAMKLGGGLLQRPLNLLLSDTSRRLIPFFEQRAHKLYR
jgi:coenzyme Q-binding protein COQ10